MNLILVSLYNFQEYILENIKQLLKLEIENIYVITNQVFFDKFELYKDKINLIALESLSDSYDFVKKTDMDKRFRNGFWTLTSLRFFYIYALMEKYNLSKLSKIRKNFEEIIIKAIRSGQEAGIEHRNNSFEIYGFDFMLDKNLNAWLLEVNLSPACAERT
jgi:hypothetical protein